MADYRIPLSRTMPAPARLSAPPGREATAAAFTLLRVWKIEKRKFHVWKMKKGKFHGGQGDENSKLGQNLNSGKAEEILENGDWLYLEGGRYLEYQLSSEC